MLFVYLLIAIAALIVIIPIIYFNRFSTLANRIENSLSQIDVQLKRRADLIPNIIETVKGYAKHESSIINAVSEARKALVGAKDLPSRIKADGKLESALGRLFAIAENYPQLKANENFLQLQEELTATEDRVAYSRQSYNDSIMTYNTLCTTFPGTLFASLFGRKKMEYVQIAPAERATPKVKF